MKMKMDARVLCLLFTLGVLLSSSYSLFSPLTIGRGSKNNVEESKITQQLQSSLLQLDQFFQSPTPAVRFLTPQTYTPLSFYFLLFSSLLFSSRLLSPSSQVPKLYIRCHLRTVGQSKAYFDRRKHIGQQDKRSNKRISSFTAPTASITEVSLVNTPCFSQDSVGNSLSNYIEARLCAAVNGLHFLAPQKMFTNNKRNESTIFAYLPALVQHQHPAKSGKSVDLEATCPCSDACHERRKALLHSRVDAVRQILDPALSAHHAIMKGRNIPILHNAAAFALPLPYNTSIYEGSRKISVISSFKTPVPIIPDVAIHYRCGDNTVGNYGFLPFAVFSDLLDKGAKTIYIMAENPYRKTQNKKNRKMDDKCAIILRALVKYITVRARESIVVLLRGANVYNDLVRLSYAKQTFCSVSTFCFYPALVQRNQVFFPATNLIADGHTFQYHDKFKWLKGDNYSVVFGARIRAASNINSILTLVGGTGNG